jgi:acetylornithine deacetylase/succinyl-diaminopimelate desuccinylase-like protein
LFLKRNFSHDVPIAGAQIIAPQQIPGGLVDPQTSSYRTMHMSPSRALEYAERHRPQLLAALKEFLRFPSVSSQPVHASDVQACARWLASHLRSIGLGRVQVIPTEGHPVVYAAWQGVPKRPTILIYGHYDVLPGDRLGEWKSPPFRPEIRDETLYGRGASDDKGQLFAHLGALEAYFRSERRLPVNVKCLIEGEEEIDSPHLRSFIERNRDALRADAAIMSDNCMLGPDRPVISYANRGNLRVELQVDGPRTDLHSGNLGGAVHNPLQGLCELLASLHDSKNRIAIPGFYKDVRIWSAKERERMARNGPSDREILRDASVGHGWGEEGFSLYERVALRPSLALNGVVGGYAGPGVKAIIPNTATAKMSFRLVPDQEPRKIGHLFEQHIARVTPPTLRTSVRILSGADPALVDPSHPAVSAAVLAYEKGFGATPAFIRSGGTFPVVSMFQKALGLPTVMMGFALPDDRIHAPNERMRLLNLFKGVSTCIWYLAAVAKCGRELEPKRLAALEHSA